MVTLADTLRQTGYTQDNQLQPQEPTGLAEMLRQHIAALPQKTEQNIQSMNNMVQNSNPYAGSGGVNPSYDPQAAKDFANYIPNLMGATAYHGTPHTIEGGFDISKVGTGEGAQAYGHGMYFAENPNVAKSYATTGNYETPEDYASHYLAESNHDPKVAIKLLKKEAEHFDKSGWEKADITKDMIPKIEEALKKGDTRSNLYKVDIPDEHIPNMLDWDKPLSEQPKHIQDVAWKYKNALITKTKMTGDKSIWDLNGADLYGVMQRYNPSEKGKLLKENVDFADVSSKLNELGVPGIRYLDQGSRDTGGTSNFVVFDPSSVKILEKNGQPTRKDIIEQQVNKVIE